MPTLELDVTADATAAAASLDSVGSAARDMATDVDAAGSASDSAAGHMDALAGAGDAAASKASQATGAFGALAGGLEAAGFPGAAAGLQGVAVATDFASGAGDLLNLVMETQAVKFLVAKVQMVAHGVATGAQATASGIATAAQWAWNAAMSANPIGLVVAGLVLLTAGIVLAYNKVGPFREAVDGAMGLAKDAIGFVVDKLGLLSDAVQLAKDGWGKIQSAASDALTPVKDAVGAVNDALDKAVGLVQDLIDWISRIDFPSFPDLNPLSRVSLGLPGSPTGTTVPAGGPVTYVTVNVTGALDPYATAVQVRDLLAGLETLQGPVAWELVP